MSSCLHPTKIASTQQRSPTPAPFIHSNTKNTHFASNRFLRLDAIKHANSHPNTSARTSPTPHAGKHPPSRSASRDICTFIPTHSSRLDPTLSTHDQLRLSQLNTFKNHFPHSIQTYLLHNPDNFQRNRIPITSDRQLTHFLLTERPHSFKSTIWARWTAEFTNSFRNRLLTCRQTQLLNISIQNFFSLYINIY